jgi:hypothetical protein
MDSRADGKTHAAVRRDHIDFISTGLAQDELDQGNAMLGPSFSEGMQVIMRVPKMKPSGGEK